MSLIFKLGYVAVEAMVEDEHQSVSTFLVDVVVVSFHLALMILEQSLQSKFSLNF